MSGPGNRRSIGRRRALLAAASSLLPAPAVWAQGRPAGTALVIGNSKYLWEATLPNVRRDAPDMAKRFQALGLQTELVQDAGRDAMAGAVDRFLAGSRNANFSAFYFAGHGASWGKDTYIVPVDSDLSTPDTVRGLISTASIRPGDKANASRLLVFDNCRNNPADGWRQLEAERSAVISPEVARVNAAAGKPNSLVLFSTAPGRVARDGPAGENSPFAAALLRQLYDASVDLQSLPSRLRRDLLIATEGKQVLWDRNSFAAPFAIGGAPRPGAAATGGSGWGGDPSRIIELTGAYAFAQENGLPLPSGLIAHRPAGNSPDGQKVGAYKYVAQSPIGRDNQLLIVMSVEEGRTAELIIAGRGRYNPQTAKGEAGTYWRFTTATVSGNKMEYVPRDGASRFVFTWKEAGSGTLTQLNENAQGSVYNTTFTRLDG
jgi:hypothetical protein